MKYQKYWDLNKGGNKMKTLKIFTLLLLLQLFACKEYTVKTKVNEDGSIVKTIEIVSRNKINNLENLAIPIDASWTMEQIKDTSTDTYKLTAQKTFNDVSELIGQYGSPGGVVIEVNHSISDKWFYTYHEYEEIIESANPFTKLSVQDYLTEDEYNALASGTINETLDEKLEDYFSAAMMEEFIYLLKQKLNEYNVKLELIDLLKDDFVKCLESDDEMICITKVLSEKYPQLDPAAILELTEKIGRHIEAETEKTFSLNGDYNYVFDMPGIILSTNASAVEGSSVSWKFSGENFTYIDYRMFAESRVANLTKMILSGVLGSLLILLLIIAIIYKRKKSN